jgi:hypothetical protein
MCRRGITIGQILASQLGLTSSHLGSNLVYLKEEVDVAKLYFRHMSEFRSNEKGCVARMANKSAKISKTVSKFLGGAGSALSYGGSAFSSVGFFLQRMHPEAQTGGLINGVITVESTEEAQNVLTYWIDSKEPLLVDVPAAMDADVAQKILNLFKSAGALELVEKSTVLMQKVFNGLDDPSDWDMV